jgi:hypothetical protein
MILTEEEFAKRFIERFKGFFHYEYEGWMEGVAEGAYEMYKDDDPETTTPEDMADEEWEELCRGG